MTTKTYLVSADHSHPDYRFADTEVLVAEQSDGFFAMHPKLGCGKTYATAWDAITHLFRDHACSNVRSTMEAKN